MARTARILSALAVARLQSDGVHLVGGVPGLGLSIVGASRVWLLRYSWAGRRPEMGLGPFPEVSLARARERAAAARDLLRSGVDPLASTRDARSAKAAADAKAKTFAECADAYVKAKAPAWSNIKHAAQWASTLRTYAYPFIGTLPIAKIDTPHILQVLEAIWLTKTETATRVRGRVESVLDWATTRKYREGPNPARWKGHLEVMLPSPRKVRAVEHHAALRWEEIPDFMAALREVTGQGARALEFAALCASRSGETRGAVWDEIDLPRRLWSIPAARMKTRQPHRVPLSKEAVALLHRLPRGSNGTLLFANQAGSALSDMTLLAVLRRMKVDAVPHGFRATFKTWATETTAFPREVIEMSLAHSVGSGVEAAYQRGDIFAKRAMLMEAWGRLCAGSAGP